MPKFNITTLISFFSRAALLLLCAFIPVKNVFAAEGASTVQLSGFFDFRATSFKTEEDNTVNEKERSGFLLEDGAVYLKYQKEKLEALIDLPFYRDNTSATDSAGLLFATGKTQAVASYSISEHFKFTFGQFDTVYGFELNDSKDRLFGNAGIVYAQTLPTVQVGAYVQYSNDGLTVRLLSANPADRDTLGSSEVDDNHETGITLGYSNSFIRSQLGYLYRPQTGLDGEEATRSLTDFLLGFTFGPVDVDAQYSVVANPQKNTLTADATDAEDSGNGLLVIVAYKPMDNLKLGVRYEALDKDPGASGYESASSYGGVVHYLVEQNITARLEWVDINTDRRDGFADAFDESRLDLGAVVTF